jgi:hypothetical protein
MYSISDVKNKLMKQWRSYKFHKAWLTDEALFPYQIKLGKPNNKTLLHQFDAVRAWVTELSNAFSSSSVIHVIRQEINFSSMGKQSLPVAIEFDTIEALARYLGKWQEWQLFCQNEQNITSKFPELKQWAIQSPGSIHKFQNCWTPLLSVCQYFLQQPQPKHYIRELDISGVDTKFVESHKAILKVLLDQILPDSAINTQYEKLTEHGFEKRFGLHHEQPRIHFRFLDTNMATDFSGITDMEIPINQFAQLDLLCDRIFITENKTNGLAFPQANNAIVIFGLGYGIQMLKQVKWINQCQLYYWGDIDTHGFAILSGIRHHFPKIHSWLMDEETLLHCREQWGHEPQEKSHQADSLPHLREPEQQLYHQLKMNHWQTALRLEQEKIPYEWWQSKL